FLRHPSTRSWRESSAHPTLPGTYPTRNDHALLTPLYRALFKADMRQAGLLEHIDPQVWTIPWNVHSQANHHGSSAFTYLAPYVFSVALSNHRLVSLTDRTVTFTCRKVGSARLRTAQLDAIAFIRRFLQHVVPHGFMKVRHLGFLHASCALPLDAVRL